MRAALSAALLSLGLASAFGAPIHLTGVAFSADGSSLVVGGADGVVRVLDPTRGTLLREFEVADSAITALGPFPESSLLYIGTVSGKVVVVDPGTGQIASSEFVREGYVSSLALTPLGLVVGGRGSSVQVREPLLALGPVATLEGLHEDAYAVATDGSGNVLAGGPGRELLVWNPDSRTVVRRLPSAGAGIVSLISDPSSPDRVAIGLDNGAVQVVDWRTGLPAFFSSADPEETIEALAFSPTGDRLYAATWQGHILAFDLTGDGGRSVWKLHRDSARAVAVSPDGSLVVSVSREGRVVGAEAATGEVRFQLFFSTEDER